MSDTTSLYTSDRTTKTDGGRSHPPPGCVTLPQGCAKGGIKHYYLAHLQGFAVERIKKRRPSTSGFDRLELFSSRRRNHKKDKAVAYASRRSSDMRVFHEMHATSSATGALHSTSPNNALHSTSANNASALSSVSDALYGSNSLNALASTSLPYIPCWDGNILPAAVELNFLEEHGSIYESSYESSKGLDAYGSTNSQPTIATAPSASVEQAEPMPFISPLLPPPGYHATMG